MNRIVQRNGAAPPWVEVQGGEYQEPLMYCTYFFLELDTAIRTFREILQQAWVRRAVRLLTISTPPALLHTISLQDLKSLRDREWVQKEQKYHEAAIEEVNSLVRKYNGLAPYSVRRPYYVLSVEMERLYDACAQTIFQELADRARNTKLPISTPTQHTTVVGTPGAWRIRDLFRAWLNLLITRLRIR